MNRADFSRLGGLPVTQYTFAFMQAAFTDAINAIAALLGPNAILSGVNVVGGNVTAGWVLINGEIVPFEAGAKTDYVEVYETIANRVYADNGTKDVYYTRKARCVVTGPISFASLQQASIVPKGVINMWSGTIASIPRGWALCDGTNGTPNLKGRFIVGYDSGDIDYNFIGGSGGEKQVTLTIDQMPAHNHGVDLFRNDTSGGAQPNTLYLGTDNGATGVTVNTANQGSGLAHENRPPYYVLAYIIKL